MQSNKVSVIITTKNRIALLKNAINSVREQTFTNWECLVVDDGSTDSTESEVGLFTEQDDRIRYVRIPPKESRGGNYARNTGIRNTTGEYVAFLDDDDVWMPEKLELQVALLEKKPEVGLVYCPVIREYLPEKIQKKIVADMAYRGDCSKKVFTHIPCTTSTMIVRRKILEQVGLFDESVKFWQEYDLTIRICQVTQIDFVNKHLVIWACNKSDKARMTNKLLEWIEAVKQQNQKYRKEIRALPKGSREARRKMILSDAVQRSYNCGDKRASRYYLKKIFEMTGKETDFFAFLLNDVSEYI